MSKTCVQKTIRRDKLKLFVGVQEFSFIYKYLDSAIQVLNN